MDSINISSDIGIEQRIITLIEPTLTDMGFELVRVALLGKQAPTLQIMVDRADGSLINIEDCEQISHALSALLDIHDPLEGAWNLEVSSAGIDRPLVRPKDWNRFAGHLARVEMMLPIGGRRRFSGIALGSDEENARLRLDDGDEVVLPLVEIRKAKLVLTDALIDACRHINPSALSDEDEQISGSGRRKENHFKKTDKTHRSKTH